MSSEERSHLAGRSAGSAATAASDARRAGVVPGPGLLRPPGVAAPPEHHAPEHHSQHASSHASEPCSAEQSPTPVCRPAGPFGAVGGPAAAPPSAPRPAAAGVCRIVLADDNPAERAALAALLAGHADLAVVAEAADAGQACEAVLHHRPDVVLLDVRTPGCDTVATLTRLVSLAPVLLLTYERDGEAAQQALRLGALGYLVHGEFTDAELADAVRAVRDTPPDAAAPRTVAVP